MRLLFSLCKKVFVVAELAGFANLKIYEAAR